MIVANIDKNFNELHDFLVMNNCKPICLTHNARYNEDASVKIQEATEIIIEIEPEKEQLLSDLVNQFMTH